MATPKRRARHAPMVIPRGTVSHVQGSDPVSDGREQGSLPLVSEGRGEPADRPSPPVAIPSGRPLERLHIALVIPNTRAFRRLVHGAYLIKDPTRQDVSVQLHVLEGPDPKEDPAAATGLVLRHAAVKLGLASPEAARLQYPEEIELGWQKEQPL